MANTDIMPSSILCVNPDALIMINVLHKEESQIHKFLLFPSKAYISH